MSCMVLSVLGKHGCWETKQGSMKDVPQSKWVQGTRDTRAINLVMPIMLLLL